MVLRIQGFDIFLLDQKKEFVTMTFKSLLRIDNYEFAFHWLYSHELKLTFSSPQLYACFCRQERQRTELTTLLSLQKLYDDSWQSGLLAFLSINLSWMQRWFLRIHFWKYQDLKIWNAWLFSTISCKIFL